MKYIAKNINHEIIFTFNYNLNGILIEFKIEGDINQEQADWLYKKYFPYSESLMKVWMKEPFFAKKFIVDIIPPDLSFEALWDLYDLKAKKIEAQKSFKKLTATEITKCFLVIPGYKKYVVRKNIGQAHLSTFINQKYYEDDWAKIK